MVDYLENPDDDLAEKEFRESLSKYLAETKHAFAKKQKLGFTSKTAWHFLEGLGFGEYKACFWVLIFENPNHKISQETDGDKSRK